MYEFIYSFFYFQRDKDFKKNNQIITLSLLNFICFKYLKLLIKLLSYINGYNRMLYVTSEIISE